MTTRFEFMVHRLCIVIALAVLAGIRPGIAAADLSSVKPFDIPPQPVPSALLAFSSQSGVQVTSSAELLEGRKSPGVVGTFSARAALDELLMGTDLHYDVVDRNTIAIRGKGVGKSPAEAATGRRSDGIALAQAGPVQSASAADPAAPSAAASSAAPSSEQPLAEVVVTGSLISESARAINTPLESMGAQEIANTGAVTIVDALSQMPDFGTGTGSTTTGFYASGQSSLNLLGLGPSRNLVLMDGRRMQPDATDQSVDINMIPRALIESVDVITGGASAVYGSDAVAGVVNFITRKHFSGVQVDAEYAPTEHGGASQEYTITAGGNFGGERGNAVFSLDYTKRESIPFLSVPFDRAYPGYTEFETGQGTYDPAGNPPSQAAVDNLFTSYGATPPPNSSIFSFNPDGTLFAADNGLSNFKGGYTLRPYQGQIAYTLIASTVQTPLNRYTAFGRATYDITPDVHAFVQAHFVNYESETIAESTNTTLSIPVTNPFIPQNLATLLASTPDPTAPFAYNKRFYEVGPRIFDRTFNMFQLEAGLSGDLKPIDATWTLYATTGRTNIQEQDDGAVLASALNTLLNAPDGGASICAGGYNPFGLTTLSQSCQQYITRNPLQVTRLTQDVVQGTLQGSLWKLPAGDMKYAVGVDYRKNGYDFRPDGDIANGTLFGFPSAGSSGGQTRVNEQFVETRIPIIANKPLAKYADLDLAYRRSDYDLSGAVNAYKGDFSWTVARPFTLRGGYERAVRAPNAGELFLAPSTDFALIGVQTAGQGGDPCSYNNAARTGPSGAKVAALCEAQGISPGLINNYYYGNLDVPAVDQGNTRLSPETADTYTLGATLRAPESVDLLRSAKLSLDYYNIDVTNVISVLPGGLALDKCFNLDGSNPTYSNGNQYCQLITRDPSTGAITSLLQVTDNLGALKTKGVTAELDWVPRLNELGLSPLQGAVALKSSWSHLISYAVQALPGAAVSDYTNTISAPNGGTYGSLPKWKGLTTIGYLRDSWNVGLRWTYLGAMRSLNTVSDPQSTTPGTTAYNLFDLFGEWDVSGHFSVTGGVNNIANRQPPVVDGIPGNTEPSTFDILGRTYFITASARFGD